MVEHPAAPIYRNHSGHRLVADDLPLLRAFTSEALTARLGESDPPDWLMDFVADVYRRTPEYRARGAAPAKFSDIPTTSRADLSRDITRFVPDDLPLDRLIEYSTSATTGHPLLLPSHPRVAAGYLAFHRRALAHFGIELRAGRGEVGIVLAGYQRRCFTYVSIIPLMDEAGLAKINLYPDEWPHPDDRARYLDDLAPELITGDPLSLSELAKLQMRHRPRALLSTSMSLSEGLRAQLEARFGCPALDVYSMNEAGPVAVYLPVAQGFLQLQNRLYIETLLPDGRPAAPGERGEITLTGGFNFFLPLLRYRTGDWAERVMSGDGPLLRDFHGRPPVRFKTLTGQWLNNVDVSHCLASFALPQYTLHQHADLSLTLCVRSPGQETAGLVKALRGLFGAGARIEVGAIEASDKIVQYTSDLS
jgi:phenylacetate-CoA ligase